MVTIKGIENICGSVIAHNDELWVAPNPTEILASQKSIQYLICYCCTSKPERIDIFIYKDGSILIERRIINGHVIKKWNTHLSILNTDNPMSFTVSVNSLIGVD